MWEISEKDFEKLIKTGDRDYVAYMELYFAEGETVVARFAGDDTLILFTNKRLISFYFPISEDANKHFRDYQFIPYKSIQHYSVTTGKGNDITGFEIVVVGMNGIHFSSISQTTVFNQYIL